ncbi:MAG: FFLEELY motif protein, partial [Anaerolineales bacterium]
MPKRTPRFNILKLLADLQKNGSAPPEDMHQLGLDSRLALLRNWQLERLSATYADFLADSRYQPACRFFMDEIYAPRDFSRRDHQFEHLYAMLARFLPAWMLRVMRDAIDLNNLTGELDDRLLQVLVNEMGMQEQLTFEMYAEAYRQCENYPLRLQQIEMLADIVREVGQGAKLP